MDEFYDHENVSTADENIWKLSDIVRISEAENKPLPTSLHKRREAHPHGPWTSRFPGK